MKGAWNISKVGCGREGETVPHLGSELICGWESAFDILLWGFGFWLLTARYCLRFGNIITTQTGTNEIINKER